MPLYYPESTEKLPRKMTMVKFHEPRTGCGPSTRECGRASKSDGRPVYSIQPPFCYTYRCKNRIAASDASRPYPTFVVSALSSNDSP